MRGSRPPPEVPSRPKTPTAAQIGGRWDEQKNTSGGRWPPWQPQQQQGSSQQPPRTWQRPNHLPAASAGTPQEQATPDGGYVELTVFLERQPGGFGFRIIGGTEEESQVAIGHIVPGGAADVDGTLRTGDEIISVDNFPVHNSTHKRVVELMGNAAMRGTVSLTVRRRVPPPHDTSDDTGSLPHASSLNASHSTLPDHAYPYDVTVSRREDEGFGFVIISSVMKAGSSIEGHGLVRSYPCLGRIIEGSPAARGGKLRVGDRILAVNGRNISQMHHEQIVSLIKECGLTVTLTVGPPQDDLTDSSNQRPGGGVAAGDGGVRSTRPLQHPHHPPNRQQQDPAILEQHRELARRQLQQVDLVDDPSGITTVQLHRGGRGFGFSIRGGQEFNGLPLYILKIAEGGAAHHDTRLTVGDQILSINNQTTDGMTHSAAIDLIQSGGSSVTLVIKKTGRPPPPIDTSRFVTTAPAPVNTSNSSFGSGYAVSSSYPTSSAPYSANGPVSQSSPTARPHYSQAPPGGPPVGPRPPTHPQQPYLAAGGDSFRPQYPYT